MSKKIEDGFRQGGATGRVGTCTYDCGVELANNAYAGNRYRVVMMYDGKMPVVLATCTDEHGNDVLEPTAEAATDALRGLMLSLAYAHNVLGVRFPDHQAMIDAIEGVV
jgi:hypothetical protein